MEYSSHPITRVTKLEEEEEGEITKKIISLCIGYINDNQKVPNLNND